MFEVFIIAAASLFFYLWRKSVEEASGLERKNKQLNESMSSYERDASYAKNRAATAEGRVLELEAISAGQNSAVEALANQYINDTLKYICSNVTANNFESSVKKADKVFKTLRDMDVEFPEEDEEQFYQKIKEVYKEEVKKDEARREQQLIKERIRDEQKALKEREDEIKRLEKQTDAIAEALEKARAKFKDEHSTEVEELKRQLAEAQANSERAKSQAQLTKAGFVYVISNIGSFGETVFKVGMTRRLEPMDRVKELGDASVPFPFDVHAMISCEDAPKLETSLHKDLHKHRKNKVNLHKEFFDVSLEDIIKSVEKHHGKVVYKAKPEAFEYNETKLISERGADIDYDPSQEVEDEAVEA